MLLRYFSAMLALLSLASTSVAAAGSSGIRLENYRYPYPEKVYRFTSQQQELEMVYMDVSAAGQTRGTVMLLHGKNFSGSYFESTANALRAAGYRIIIPDQIGFGKSTKPPHYQFTLQQLASNTRALLQSLGVSRVHVLGHSMGGMIAARFALMFPESTASLTLVNPLGLEDWKTLGVPYTSIDETYRQELKKNRETIRTYQLETYYDGKWQAAYDPWVDQLASFCESPDYPRMAWNQALTADMIFTQPVVQEFGRLRMPVLLIIGQRDRTALGRALAPPDVRPKLGNYPALGRAAKAAIPDAELVELDGVGHMPHIEAFERFIRPCRDFFDRHSAADK
jgi:pimeloyl-ACP methyl ester carboxylesterase